MKVWFCFLKTLGFALGTIQIALGSGLLNEKDEVITEEAHKTQILRQAAQRYLEYLQDTGSTYYKDSSSDIDPPLFDKDCKKIFKTWKMVQKNDKKSIRIEENARSPFQSEKACRKQMQDLRFELGPWFVRESKVGEVDLRNMTVSLRYVLHPCGLTPGGSDFLSSVKLSINDEGSITDIIVNYFPHSSLPPDSYDIDLFLYDDRSGKAS